MDLAQRLACLPFSSTISWRLILDSVDRPRVCYEQDRRESRESPIGSILLHIRVHLEDPITHQLQRGGDLVFGYTSQLFIHRKALRTIYDRHRVGMNSKLGDALSIPDQVWLEDSALKQSGMEDEDEMVIEDDGGWESVTENEDNVVTATNDDPIPIPWSSWGPPITL